MTSISMLAYGMYLIATGILLVVVPGLTLGIVGLELDSDTWIRVVGVLAAEIGFYFVVATQRGISEFFLVSVYGRFGVAIALALLALTQLGPPQLLLFVLVDSASALWTMWGMKAEVQRRR